MTIEPQGYAEFIKAPHKASSRLSGWCAIDLCHQPQATWLPLCEGHAHDVWAEVEQWNDLAKKRKSRDAHQALEKSRDDMLRERLARDESQRNAKRQAGHIYYLRVGDLIKIGFTSDMETRMKQYPPNAILLAQHPGTRETERHMHEKFQPFLALRREWFTPCDEITAHIEMVRTQFTDRAA